MNRDVQEPKIGDIWEHPEFGEARVESVAWALGMVHCLRASRHSFRLPFDEPLEYYGWVLKRRDGLTFSTQPQSASESIRALSYKAQPTPLEDAARALLAKLPRCESGCPIDARRVAVATVPDPMASMFSGETMYVCDAHGERGQWRHPLPWSAEAAALEALL